MLPIKKVYYSILSAHCYAIYFNASPCIALHRIEQTERFQFVFAKLHRIASPMIVIVTFSPRDFIEKVYYSVLLFVMCYENLGQKKTRP